MDVKKYIFSWMLLLILNGLSAQNVNTLEWVKKLNSEQKYTEALDVVSVYYKKHKKDLYAGWVYGQTLHLAKKYKLSQAIYKKTVLLFPNNNDLKLDRIHKLTEEGEFYNAILLTKKIINSLPKDYKFVAHKNLAQIYFWKGDYDRANIEIDKALSIYSTEKSGLKLKHEIEKFRSNWVAFGLNYFMDDQPLTTIIPSIKTGYYINSRMSLGADLSYPFYSFSDSSYQTPWLKAVANFNLLESKIGIKTELGWIGFSSKEKSITARMNISKKLMKYLSVNVNAAYEPYLSTVFTIQDKLMHNNIEISFDWNNPKGFVAKVGFIDNIFSELDNSFYSVSGWGVSPPLKVADFEFRGGYGINYSDSKNNLFIPKETINEVVSNWIEDYAINGHYNPIFTPNEQLIHSLVGMVAFKPNAKFSLGLDFNYGIVAGARSPYFYIGLEDGGELGIMKAYNNIIFHPIDIHTFLNYNLNEKLSINLFYKYQKTFFYQSNLVGLKSKMLF